MLRENRTWLRFRLLCGRQRPGALPQTAYKPLLDFFQMLDLAADPADFVSKLLANLRTSLHVALQIQQFSNFGQREAEGLRLLDELELLDIVIGEQAEAPIGSNRTMEQHLLLVEAYGVR